MQNGKLLKLSIGTLFALLSTFAAHDTARAGGPTQVTPNASNGFASVYGNIPASQAEFLSTPDRIRAVAASGAPSAIWEALEHGERVECLDCIPAVAPLLYDSNAKTREIAAWWLRRRIFGVFEQGGVYQQTINTLAGDSNPVRRAYAAYALGEFFATPGIAACAQAIVNDTSAQVRAAAASALGRLNDDGGGALSTALSDSNASVRLAALGSAVRINTFSGLAAVTGLTMDSDVSVRRRALEVLDALQAKDAVVAVAAVAQNDSNAGVRAAACHALGTFGDTSAFPVLQHLASSDPDMFVRDQANIAIRRL
jgi:HEAT repeat protein